MLLLVTAAVLPPVTLNGPAAHPESAALEHIGDGRAVDSRIIKCFLERCTILWTDVIQHMAHSASASPRLFLGPMDLIEQ
jgi:hypothetical protein